MESTGCRVRRALGWEKGQATVEFAIVLAAFVVVAVGLSALWHALDQGVFVQHALQSASHHLEGAESGAWGDVLAY